MLSILGQVKDDRITFGLICKGSKYSAIRSTENRRFRPPTFVFRETFRISNPNPNNYKLPETSSFGYILILPRRFIFIQIKWRARKTYASIQCKRPFRPFSGSSKGIDFDTHQSRMCDFLLVINSNLGPILHHFGDTVT